MVAATRNSKILGPDGKPVQVALLDGELAEPAEHGVRRVIEDRQASGLTPERLARILRSAETGHGRDYLTLAFEMEERYLHYSSQVQTRRLAIEGIEPIVSAPEGTDSKQIDAVKMLVEDYAFTDMAGDLTDGIGKGYSVVEPAWEYENKLLKPVQYKWRDQRFFVFDRRDLSDLRLATDADPTYGEELPPYAFIKHFPRTKAGIPLRAGLARPAAWAFIIQTFALQDWSAFAEIYGVPLRLGRYGPNASDSDKRSLLRAVKAISNDGAAIAPTGMEIEFHKIEGQHGAAVFGQLIDYVDRQVSKMVLGQTMTSDDGSSLAQAEIHNEVRLDILRADCRQLAQTINRELVEPFIAFNFGPQERYPLVEFQVTEPEDTKALTENVARLVPLGLRVSQRTMRERLALPEPGDDEELLAPATTATPVQPGEEKTAPKSKRKPGTANLSAHVEGCQCTGCQAILAAEGEADEIERLSENALDEWEDITDPLLAPLRAILAEATNLQEAQSMLAAAEPNGGKLTEALAKLTAISRGLGDTGDDLPKG